MKITSAEFVTSAVKPSQYPHALGPEIAFAGRSNVGKSSLMNTLLGRKGLVKTSSTPGRTQTINFFQINDRFCFVDLPGYGYAKVPEAVRKRWGPMVEEYLKTRRIAGSSGPEVNRGLCGVVGILDIRRVPDEADRNLLTWLAYYKIPVTLAVTKADKLKKGRQDQQRELIARELSVDPSSLIIFSATTGQGKRELWARIEPWL